MKKNGMRQYDNDFKKVELDLLKVRVLKIHQGYITRQMYRNSVLGNGKNILCNDSRNGVVYSPALSNFLIHGEILDDWLFY
jgi:hypothetical protein